MRSIPLRYLIALIFLFTALSTVYPQNKLWEVETTGNKFIILPDIDNDGSIEFLIDNIVYDFKDATIKYSLNVPDRFSIINATRGNSKFQLGSGFFDFNNNGTIDLYFFDETDSTSKIIDPTNSEILMSIKGKLEAVGDLTGDGLIDLLTSYNTVNYNIGSGDFYLYLFSTNAIPTKLKSKSLPLAYKLKQNYPNPFNPSTKIDFNLPQKSYVKINVYNSNGELIRVLLNEEKAAGTHSVDFNAYGISSGVYFYQILADGYMNAKKMILLK